jgi:hypothetical protein
VARLCSAAVQRRNALAPALLCIGAQVESLPCFTQGNSMNTQSDNPEVARLRYLQAMGITSYYPRLQLPGALPSQACAWPFAEAAEDTAGTAAERTSIATTAAPIAGSAQTTGSRAALQQALRTGAPPEIDSDRPAPKGVQTDPGPTTATTPDTAASEALHFQLLLLQVDAELAVVLQIPALAKPQLQNRQAALLTNLLRWLGKPAPLQNAPRVFHWPLPGLSLTNSRTEAGNRLLQFLEQACIEQPFRYLLFLGEQAADCLQVHRGKQQSPDWPWLLASTHSLDEMLALPPLKRVVWQSLLPFHAALTAPRAAQS